MSERSFDIICMGRAAVDFYGDQIGSRLEDMTGFSKYLGGSAANTAFGCSILGLRAAMLTRVGDEHMGRFVREELARAGVDVSHVVTDPSRLTGLVVLGIKDQETFPLIFFRTDCADMAVSVEDFDERFIASSKAFLVNGTHCSTEHTYHTAKTALEMARRNGVKTVFDIDYRPVLWGLTRLGDGETRFISDDGVSRHLQSLLPLFDLIVGTEEEIHIAGGSTDTLQALRTIRELSQAIIVLKRGPYGATVFDGAIPADLDDGITVKGVKVEVLNVLGAGDSFMAGFLRGWLREEGYNKALTYANACGALVVSRHGCAPAMPTSEELDDYLSRAQDVPRPDRDQRLNYLHRVTTRYPREWPELCVLAMDHRKQFFDMAQAAGVSEDRIPALKNLLLKAAEQGAQLAGLNGQAGVLLDDSYGQAALNAITGRGWWIGRPVELPGSRPLELEGGRSIGSRLQTWPREHVVKCLLFYHPDDPVELRLAQERQVLELYQACCVSGHELLLEIIPPQDLPQDETTLARAIERFYNLEVYPDWWKLAPQTPVVWDRLSSLIATRQPHCRGIVLLGLDAPNEELRQGFRDCAAFPLIKGFTVGRTIFSEPSRRWLHGELNDNDLINAVSQNYLRLIRYWRER